MILLFWPPIIRDHEAEAWAREGSRCVDDDVRLALRRPAFGVRRRPEMGMVSLWFGWVELRWMRDPPW